MRFHQPVLVDEIINFLKADAGGKFFDGTFGQGGHTREILLANKKNIVCAMDRDKSVFEIAERFTAEFKNRFFFASDSFRNIEEYFEVTSFDGFLLDLGISQRQIFEVGRGFSFHDHLSLDCRIDQTEKTTTAKEIVNSADRKNLRRILRSGGIGREVDYIVNTIIRHRPFDSAKDLCDRVVAELPKRLTASREKKLKALLMQALRIEANKEFDHLGDFLDTIRARAKPNSRLCVICFHSLEDKFVTSRLRAWTVLKEGNLLTKKAVRPSTEELESNPSSRSSLLRVFEFRNRE
ncbi:MAG: 16S rRNA (cytosine(1402)-N(4))-methyltransferase RsmH [Deltaproteobacteria bacterium]|nr:16S rRNA (cytosine(1402)-N(4))-methyltransferase RsmH [Deltaproteobacteria bacterium]